MLVLLLALLGIFIIGFGFIIRFTFSLNQDFCFDIWTGINIIIAAIIIHKFTSNDISHNNK